MVLACLIIYHLLGIGLVDVGEASVLVSDEMSDEGEGVLQFRNDGVLIFLMRIVITCRDVGATHTDVVEIFFLSSFTGAEP